MSHPVPDGSLGAFPLDGPAPARVRAQRGRPIRRIALVGAVVFAGLVGLSAFLALYSVDLISTQPVAGSGAWLVLLLLGTIGSAATFALSVVVAVYCRPKPMAVLTLALSAALPAAALVAGVHLGLAVLKAHTVADLASVGDDVQVVTGLLDTWDVEAAPLRAALDAVARILG